MCFPIGEAGDLPERLSNGTESDGSDFPDWTWQAPPSSQTLPELKYPCLCRLDG